MVEIKILDPKIAAEPKLLPKYATRDSAGVDLIACIDTKIEIPPMQARLIPTGISINMQTIDEWCAAFIFPRSGKGHKEGKVLGNLVGVIDQDYHGQLMVSMWNRNADVYVTIEPLEKFAQLVFMPIIRPDFKVVEEFSSDTERGEGGFGSTG
jgi:dUTP pyrophosphatase